MKLSFRQFLLIIFLTFILAGCAPRERSGLGPGEKPPAIELLDLDNKMRSLDEFKGKVVLLNFWATWCMPCVSEMPALQRLYDRYHPDGFEIVSVGVDDEQQALNAFKEKNKITFPVLVDRSGTVKSRYGLTGVPESFMIGRDGRLILYSDPQDNTARVRLVGPRDWESPANIRSLEAALGKK